ncbi:unnamed protein product [Pedinophyceae sp. YPF-701]|nr:unnamed protein product [Pedinophyceae sp. YPF-701]
MDFSEAYKCTGPAPAHSPDGRCVACVVDYRLVIRDAETLQVLQLYSCIDKVEHIEWSCDSAYVLCGLFKRATVQVWSVDQPEFTCTIAEGPAGVREARWGPDGRHVITCADFNLRLAVWNLRTKEFVHIPSPKTGASGVAFSPDGRYMAVPERRACKDYVRLYACGSWELLGRFSVDTTDLAGLAISPDGAYIACWDSELQYKVVVLALNGSHVATFEAYHEGLGVRAGCATWSPSGHVLAAGSYDDTLRMLSNVTWRPLAELDHPGLVDGPMNCVVYEEAVEAGPEGERSRFEVRGLPAEIPSRPVPDESPEAPRGVSRVAFSPCGRWVASTSATMPRALWVWDTHGMALTAVLVLAAAVTDVAWSGGDVAQLAITSGGPRVYLWSQHGASCVHVPLGGLKATQVSWSPNNASFVLAGASSFCCAYLAPDDEDQG